MANFEVFRQVNSSSINLLFLKIDSAKHGLKYESSHAVYQNLAKLWNLATYVLTYLVFSAYLISIEEVTQETPNIYCRKSF